MDSSHYLHYWADFLVQLDARVKFFLTIRDPYSWLKSEINQNFVTKDDSTWQSLEHYRYGKYRHDFEKAEASLSQFPHLYPITSYLMYWKDHINRVLDHVPADRLLIIRTESIRQSAGKIAGFLGIDPSTIDMNQSHTGIMQTRYLDLDKVVNKDFVLQKIYSLCGDLMDIYYPNLLYPTDKVQNQG
jgi:hypothetical protein